MVDKMLMFSHHKIPFMLVKVLQVKKISVDNKTKCFHFRPYYFYMVVN